MRSPLSRRTVACLALPLALVPFVARAAAPVAISIDNFAFTPQVLTVPLGTIVTWKNGDDIPHTIVDTGGAFRSPVLDTDDAFSFTFATVGEYGYFCGLHPHMTGRIIVTRG
ncbi:Cupredoxin-like domain-containing protein [Humitalea rosea]|uniref:Cupredoxin-like domain-containing protein n=1 Tax=Humitalea rosea TaxID=990373 RepID=A0A2W7IND3_9PROT|nr:cupredoxin family copper-binding protein [Humitalea rosea]PZW48418.1 Cupredoxin-like domain-containing protein [Humitalea rosea]